MKYVIGLDLGTTNIKAQAYDLKGNQIGATSRSVQTIYPNEEKAEQDPDEIVEYAFQCLEEVIQNVGSGPAGIGLSAAMHSLILLDNSYRPLTNSIIWSDRRGAAVAEELNEDEISESLLVNCGTPIHALSPLVKIRWFRKRELEIFRKARFFADIKSYLIMKLTGHFVVDESIASASGMFDVKESVFFLPALKLAGIRRDELPKPHPADHILPMIKYDVAKRLKINAITPIILGGSDGCLANLGAFGLLPSKIVMNIGTSAALRYITRGTGKDYLFGMFKYIILDEYYVRGAASNNAGNILTWWYDRNENKSLEDDLTSISDVPIGSEGLVFVPWIFGERPPLGNARSEGGFINEKPDQYYRLKFRALIEGVLFNLYELFQEVEKASMQTFNEILLTGGLAKYNPFIQMIADIFGVRIIRHRKVDHSAFGAALIAIEALGFIRSYEQIIDHSAKADHFYPDEKNSAAYKKAYNHYLAMIASK